MALGNPCSNDMVCANFAEKDRAECSACRYARRTSPVSRIEPAARTLMIDIETAPIQAYTWGIWQQNVGLNQIIEPGRMLCFGARWLGEKRTMFYSEHTHGRESMIAKAHVLLDEADVVMHFNGVKFDAPWLNTEFVRTGLKPPSPYVQLDLLAAVKKRFRFPSNKLAYVSKALGLDGKVEHEGFELWVKCLAGADAAWQRMEKYCRRDVVLLEELYQKLLPWLPTHANGQLYGGTGCPHCGSAKIQRRGYAYTKVSKFRQFRCSDCGSYFRSTKRESGVEIQQVAS